MQPIIEDYNLEYAGRTPCVWVKFDDCEVWEPISHLLDHLTDNSIISGFDTVKGLVFGAGVEQEDFSQQRQEWKQRTKRGAFYTVEQYWKEHITEAVLLEWFNECKPSLMLHGDVYITNGELDETL